MNLLKNYVKKEENMINGETFNRTSREIAIKRLWSKMNNYDAININNNEGYQLLILNTNKLSINNIDKFDNFYLNHIKI